MFSNHNEIKLEINKENVGKLTNMWKLSKHYSLIEITREIKNYSEMNENGTYQNWGVVKVAFRGKFIVVNDCIKSTT